MRLKSPKKSKLGPSPSLKHEVRRHSKGRRASTCIIGDETARHTKLHFRKFREVTPRWTERNFQICFGFTDRMLEASGFASANFSQSDGA
jgi:hypothetical protein